MATAELSSVTIKDATATTNTLSYLTDPNNSSRKVVKVFNDASMAPTPVFAYGASLTPAATPTDIVTLKGSNAKTIRVRKITASFVSTAAGAIEVRIIKRSAANTGGTATAPSPAAFDSVDDAAVEGVLAQYSANPSELGTGICVNAVKLGVDIGTSASNIAVFDFTDPSTKPLLLRGTSDYCAINLNGGALPTGTSLAYSIEWSEDDS